MALIETSGHQLDIGDRVKMNIKVIGEGDMDGVAFTTNGKDYWRYMNEHPNEVYTVTDYDRELDQYILSGYMGDNSWCADEQIHVPQPETVFEDIKNMTFEEMKERLFRMVLAQCEDGVPSPDAIAEWLQSKPENDK